MTTKTAAAANTLALVAHARRVASIGSMIRMTAKRCAQEAQWALGRGDIYAYHTLLDAETAIRTPLRMVFLQPRPAPIAGPAKKAAMSDAAALAAAVAAAEAMPEERERVAVDAAAEPMVRRIIEAAALTSAAWPESEEEDGARTVELDLIQARRLTHALGAAGISYSYSEGM